MRKEPSLTKRCEKSGKDAKRAEKMRKEPSFMRKEALLYRNKLVLKMVYVKHNMSELG